MPYLLDFFYLLSLLVLSPWLVYKALTMGKYRRGLLDKLLGRAFRRTGPQPCVWFHGVSVGEIHLLRPVVARFRQRHPDWDCVLSTTTDTGFEEARKHFVDLPVFYWPLDFSWAVQRSLCCVNPSLVVLAEGELWPNFLAAARARAVPVAVVNGRLSPRSCHHYQLLGRWTRRWLTCVDLYAVQTEEYAACFRTLGVPAARLQVTGSVKYDGVLADRHNDRTQELRHLLQVHPGDTIWIAGSTQAPEEQVAVDIYCRARRQHPRLRLFLVPRQKERFDEVAAWLRDSGQPFVRRSSLMAPLSDRSAVVLVDTIGDLGALWGLADVAFVGGSLDGRRGGQNMIEPAAYGAAVVFGPHVWNFRDTAARLTAAGAAIQIADAAELEATVHHLLTDTAERHRLGTAAQQFVRTQQGATARTIDCLEQLLAAQQRRDRAA